MSEERFERIEQRLDGLWVDMAEIKADVAELKTDVAELKTDVAGLKTDVAGLKTDVGGLKGAVTDLQRESRDLRIHMGVLHEDLVDRIKAIREDDSLRREMRAGFAELKQLLLDHAIPGDAADRHFAATLHDHEQRISTLERR
jgi:uncharacterized coiled-coil DUF342 family protein